MDNLESNISNCSFIKCVLQIALLVVVTASDVKTYTLDNGAVFVYFQRNNDRYELRFPLKYCKKLLKIMMLNDNDLIM